MAQRTIFGKVSAQAVVANDTIKKFMATTKNKYTFSKDASMKAFFADCLFAITQDPMARRWWKTSREVKTWMSTTCGIESSKDFNDLFLKNILDLKKMGFIMSSFKNYTSMLDAAKKALENGQEISTENLTKLQRKGAEYIKANGRGLTREEVTEEVADKTRLMVVRSKYGTSEVKFYTISGGSINQNDPRISAIKAAYHYETGCRYFEARPILYSSWINLPVERQNATVMTDSSDM